MDSLRKFSRKIGNIESTSYLGDHLGKDQITTNFEKSFEMN